MRGTVARWRQPSAQPGTALHFAAGDSGKCCLAPRQQHDFIRRQHAMPHVPAPLAGREIRAKVLGAIASAAIVITIARSHTDWRRVAIRPTAR
jgi:hypothetical protein